MAKLQLETELRTLIEPERVHLEERLRNYHRSTVNRFIEKRTPKQSWRDFFPPEFGIDPFLIEATNHVETYAAASKQSSLNPVTKKWEIADFDVKLTENAEEVIAKIAAREVEFQIQMFVSRALSKLQPVVEKKPDYTIVKDSGRLDGAWVGTLFFTWEDGDRFQTELKFKLNRSKWGKLFWQYPMTFHNVNINGTAPNSIEDIWKAVGIFIPPKSEFKRPRWTKLVKGSIVEHEGEFYLFLTNTQLKKLGVPNTARQVARVEASRGGNYIQFFTGEEKRKLATQEDKDYDDQNFQQFDYDGLRIHHLNRAFELFKDDLRNVVENNQ